MFDKEVEDLVLEAMAQMDQRKFTWEQMIHAARMLWANSVHQAYLTYEENDRHIKTYEQIVEIETNKIVKGALIVRDAYKQFKEGKKEEKCKIYPLKPSPEAH